jgi:hypothetical protein
MPYNFVSKKYKNLYVIKFDLQKLFDSLKDNKKIKKNK